MTNPKKNITISYATGLAVNDMRNIFREKSLVVLLIAPILIFSVIRFGLPMLENLVPETLAYQPDIIAVFTLVISLFPAFILSFIAMDEKESGLIHVFNILPGNYASITKIRLLYCYGYGFLVAFIVLSAIPFLAMKWHRILLLCLQFAFSGPLVYLIIIRFSAQKIVAMTWMKGLNFIMMLPAIGVFLPAAWKYIFSPLPSFWMFQSFISPSETAFYLHYLPGLIIPIFYLVLLIRIEKQTYNSKVRNLQ